MSETVFTKVDYTLGPLIEDIALGKIGLPDIQRPFVWKNAKVRNLFDSMYKGYPVGYFLFWDAASGESRAIGADQKQKAPRLLIVDGQQRLVLRTLHRPLQPYSGPDGTGRPLGQAKHH